MKLRWIAAFLFATCATSAFADSCVSNFVGPGRPFATPGTVASYDFATCTIGNLSISFDDTAAFGSTFSGLGDLSQNVTVTPYLNGNQAGFTFSGLTSVHSFPGLANASVADSAILNISSLTLLNGATLTGAGAFITGSDLLAPTGLAANSACVNAPSPSGDVLGFSAPIVQNGVASTLVLTSCVGFNGSNYSFRVDNSAQAGISATLAGAQSYTVFLTTETPTPAPVPEPGSLALMGSGLLCLAGVGRRKLIGLVKPSRPT